MAKTSWVFGDVPTAQDFNDIWSAILAQQAINAGRRLWTGNWTPDGTTAKSFLPIPGIDTYNALMLGGTLPVYGDPQYGGATTLGFRIIAQREKYAGLSAVAYELHGTGYGNVNVGSTMQVLSLRQSL